MRGSLLGDQAVREQRFDAASVVQRHRFPAEVIHHAVWLLPRPLSFRDRRGAGARGIHVSYKTIRCWTIKVGAQIAKNLKSRRVAPCPCTKWSAPSADKGSGLASHDFARTSRAAAPAPDELKMQGFKSIPSAQRFLTTHAGVYNAFHTQRPLISRDTIRTSRTAAFECWSDELRLISDADSLFACCRRKLTALIS